MIHNRSKEKKLQIMLYSKKLTRIFMIAWPMEKIILFYKYTHLENPERIKNWLLAICSALDLRGRIILAQEGINGTLGGAVKALDAFVLTMNEHPAFQNIDFKESPGKKNDFPRLSIKVKPEIVKLGLDPRVVTPEDCGEHLTPAQAHELMQAHPEDLVILDGRNNYESRIGAFEGAIKPDVTYFREFPEYVDNNSDLFKDKQVLMYCTGGIRCERASAYLKSKGVAKKVYQITGGIHRYAEQFPDGFFKGKNYVFDARIATPVSEDILSTCDFCESTCDTYRNCRNALCNKQIIVCDSCDKTHDHACSKKCQELLLSNAVQPRPVKYRLSCSQ